MVSKGLEWATIEGRLRPRRKNRSAWHLPLLEDLVYVFKLIYLFYITIVVSSPSSLPILSPTSLLPPPHLFLLKKGHKGSVFYETFKMRCYKQANQTNSNCKNKLLKPAFQTQNSSSQGTHWGWRLGLQTYWFLILTIRGYLKLWVKISDDSQRSTILRKETGGRKGGMCRRGQTHLESDSWKRR